MTPASNEYCSIFLNKHKRKIKIIKQCRMIDQMSTCEVEIWNRNNQGK